MSSAEHGAQEADENAVLVMLGPLRQTWLEADVGWM